ncbi:MAG: DUF4251 domain-containing protein [Tannerella sp.]|jgi:hypothetical protein|nr:DUF4251 domain-containing protein [Tannerella sp.]
MKKIFKCSLFVIITTLLSACASLQGISKEEKAARETALKEAINKQEYVVDVNCMIPMKGNSKHLSSSYSLTIKRDEIISYLPYFGEAYNIPYGGGKGLNFKAKINKYNALVDNKGKTIIELETKNEEDHYVYHIEIFPNGAANISVRSHNRQSISYSGTAEEIKEKEQK